MDDFIFTDEEILQMYIAEKRRNAALAAEKRGEQRGIRRKRRRFIEVFSKDSAFSEQLLRKLVPDISEEELSAIRQKQSSCN